MVSHATSATTPGERIPRCYGNTPLAKLEAVNLICLIRFGLAGLFSFGLAGNRRSGPVGADLPLGPKCQGGTAAPPYQHTVPGPQAEPKGGLGAFLVNLAPTRQSRRVPCS
jgi:hypothetical protein